MVEQCASDDPDTENNLGDCITQVISIHSYTSDKYTFLPFHRP